MLLQLRQENCENVCRRSSKIQNSFLICVINVSTNCNCWFNQFLVNPFQVVMQIILYIQVTFQLLSTPHPPFFWGKNLSEFICILYLLFRILLIVIIYFNWSTSVCFCIILQQSWSCQVFYKDVLINLGCKRVILRPLFFFIFFFGLFDLNNMWVV